MNAGVRKRMSVSLALACVVSVVTMLVGPEGASIYDVGRWILLAAFAAVTVALALTRLDRRVLAVVAVVLAVQLAATGVVGTKHWGALCGPGACYNGSFVLERILAIAMVVANAAACAVCVAALRGGAFVWRGGRSVVAIVAGILAAVSTVWLLSKAGAMYRDTTSLGAFMILYALPWGGSIVAAGWLEARSALVATLTVAGSAVVVATTHQLIAFSQDSLAAGLTAATLALIAGVIVGGGDVVGRQVQRASPGTGGGEVSRAGEA